MKIFVGNKKIILRWPINIEWPSSISKHNLASNILQYCKISMTDSEICDYKKFCSYEDKIEYLYEYSRDYYLYVKTCFEKIISCIKGKDDKNIFIENMLSYFENRKNDFSKRASEYTRFISIISLAMTIIVATKDIAALLIAIIVWFIISGLHYKISSTDHSLQFYYFINILNDIKSNMEEVKNE